MGDRKDVSAKLVTIVARAIVHLKDTKEIPASVKKRNIDGIVQWSRATRRFLPMWVEAGVDDTGAFVCRTPQYNIRMLDSSMTDIEVRHSDGRLRERYSLIERDSLRELVRQIEHIVAIAFVLRSHPTPDSVRKTVGRTPMSPEARKRRRDRRARRRELHRVSR